MKQDTLTTQRIEVVDALRGFAVMAILLLHNVEHFIFSVYPTESANWLSVLDKGVLNVSFALFGGKAYAIFSLLFGFTFAIQYARQKQQGRDFGYRFLWRLVVLALIATLNAAFFPGGDVLMLYAIMGVVLFITRRWSNCVVLAVAVLCLLQPMEWYHYIVSLINPSHALPDYGVGALYDTVGEATRCGSLLRFLWCNITTGQVASFMWAVGAGRVWQTAGLFLIGAYLGRKQLFVSNERNQRFWIITLIISAVAFTPLFSLRNEIMGGTPLVQQTVGTVFDMWQKLAFTFVLVASFVLLYQFEGFRTRIGGLRYYGKMSLTNYVSQSIIGAIIYFPFFLYLAPYCGYTISLLIGFAVFFAQLSFCRWWLRNHQYGPLEGLWKRWTYALPPRSKAS